MTTRYFDFSGYFTGLPCILMNDHSKQTCYYLFAYHV